MQGPHIQIIVDRDPVPLPLQAALNRMDARVSIRSIAKAADDGVLPTADVCVILSRSDHPADLLERIMSRASDCACATMVLPAQGVSDGSPARWPLSKAIDAGQRPLAQRLNAPEACVVDILNADEIIGRIKALWDIRRPLCRMRDELNRLKRARLDAAGDDRDLDEQLRLAGQVQNDLLPKPLADTAPLAISTLYLPADYVSGDIYDIARLDETRIGFSIADVTGHGLPAALLTFLIKKSLLGKEIFDDKYRIIEPDELLGRLNDDLLHARLTECQFVTAMHAVFDRATCRIRWARGGCPYPILIRHGSPAQRVISEGGLIGAFPQHFDVASHDLQPGDVLVFYTDGVEALLFDHKNAPGTGQNPSILQTDWVRMLETKGPEAALHAIRDLASRSANSDWPADDITIIALRMT